MMKCDMTAYVQKAIRKKTRRKTTTMPAET
jgi:hypothetical protein